MRRTILWDTSYVSRRRRLDDERSVHAPLGLDERVAVSVVTVAEIRFGYRRARWGTRRAERVERWLDGFARFEVDEQVADTWARLKVAGQSRGRAFSDNDLWIAATSSALGVPVVSCDRDFVRMRDLGVRVIFVRPDGSSSTR